MTNTIKMIEIHSHEADFFDGMEGTQNVNTDATIEKYQEIVRETLNKSYPDAEIEFINEGTVSSYLVIDGDDGHPSDDDIKYLISQVWDDSEKFWVEN